MFVFQKRRNLSLGGCKKSHLTFLTASFKAVEVTWKALNEVDKKTLKKYLTDLILKREMPDLLSCVQSNETVLKIFDKSDLQFIRNADVQVEIPDSLHKTSWTLYDFTRKRKPKLEIKQLEQDLIATYDHKEIRDLLKKISMNQLGTSVWNINPQWDLPIPIQSVLKSLPRGIDPRRNLLCFNSDG
jgi:hypothetical protein